MFDPEKVFLPPGSRKAIPVKVVTEASWLEESKRLTPPQLAWAEGQGFSGRPETHLLVADRAGKLGAVYAGVRPGDSGFGLARLCSQLPPGAYSVDEGTVGNLRFAELAWTLESYAYDRFKPRKKHPAQLVCRRTTDFKKTMAAIKACCLVRDLVNSPANELGPDELEAAARKFAKEHKASLAVTKGKALERNFPMVHAVGQASDRRPRLIDIGWGPSRAPRVTLVGKGVCFDTGGLDIKPSSGMLLMKKDMGGAAHVLGLASMIIKAKLPVRLRVIIPAVENAISGNAMRPGDVYRTRKGLTVEIGNTDAEGRLILSDALHLADEDKPDLLIDMATLTGSARVALGPELPPFYTDDDELAEQLARHSEAEKDPVWRMPLWRPYASYIETPVADLNNSAETSFAGSITAALFLRRFVEKAKSYVHFDIYAWVPSARPGSPKGGEAQAIRALFALISSRYGKGD